MQVNIITIIATNSAAAIKILVKVTLSQRRLADTLHSHDDKRVGYINVRMTKQRTELTR